MSKTGLISIMMMMLVVSVYIPLVAVCVYVKGVVGACLWLISLSF